MTTLDFHDPVSAATHLFMAGWLVFVGLVLLRRAAHHTGPQKLSLVAFILSAVTLYTFSGLFHGLAHPSEAARRTWQRLDQSAIFWLIVGSNVPVAVYLLRPPFRRWLLIGLCAVAGLGTLGLWVLPKPIYELQIGGYVGLGFLGLVALPTYYRAIGRGGLVCIGLLALGYVGGALCEALRWPVVVPGVVGPHELLHIGDMFGTAAHIVLLMRYVLPRNPVAVSR